MVIRALYEYALAHPEIVQRPGFEYRSVPFVVDLSTSGVPLGVRKLDKESRRVMCPSAGNIASRIEAHPVAEKASVAICVEPDGNASDKLEKKREIFAERFRQGAATVPAFEAVALALSEPGHLSVIQEKFAEAGGTSADVVGFSVGGVDLWDNPSVSSWWEKEVLGNKDKDTEKKEGGFLDVVTGLPCNAARLWKQMKGRCAAGGQPSGVSLVSFNEPAFASYGLTGKQGENCPVSEETMLSVMDALAFLSDKAESIGTVRFVHWYSSDVPEEDDVFDFVFGLEREKEADALAHVSKGDMEVEAANDEAANRLVRSPFSGEVPPLLEGVRYHMMQIQPVAARMVVRGFKEGSYEELQRNVASWYRDMQLVASDGTVPGKYPKLYALMRQLLSEAELARRSDVMAPLAPHIASICDACFSGGSIPDAIGYRALSAFRSGMYPSAGEDVKWGSQYRRVQWMKLWINRKKGKEKSMGRIAESLDKNSTNPAYVCGRIMAVYDIIQRKATELNSTVVSRYFTACSQSPAMVLGKLQQMSVHHLEKIESKGLREFFRIRLEEAWEKIEGNIPKRLSTEEQAYFTLGYWQEMAYLRLGGKTNPKNNNNNKED